MYHHLHFLLEDNAFVKWYRGSHHGPCRNEYNFNDFHIHPQSLFIWHGTGSQITLDCVWFHFSLVFCVWVSDLLSSITFDQFRSIITTEKKILKCPLSLAYTFGFVPTCWKRADATHGKNEPLSYVPPGSPLSHAQPLTASRQTCIFHQIAISFFSHTVQLYLIII
jgi:hypothetical protein